MEIVFRYFFRLWLGVGMNKCGDVYGLFVFWIENNCLGINFDRRVDYFVVGFFSCSFGYMNWLSC